METKFEWHVEAKCNKGKPPLGHHYYGDKLPDDRTFEIIIDQAKERLGKCETCVIDCEIRKLASATVSVLRELSGYPNSPVLTEGTRT
jgi:hypothetical protein